MALINGCKNIYEVAIFGDTLLIANIFNKNVKNVIATTT